jgi:hypothetical protein
MISVMLAVQTVAVSKANREWLVVALVMTPTVDDICSQDERSFAPLLRKRAFWIGGD